MTEPQQEAVAIVGAACRFSGDVRSPSDMWEMLTSVRSGHCRVPDDRWEADAWAHPDADRKGGMPTKHGYFIKDDVARFDAPFFSISAKEAAAMDPMKRMLLEVCYESIENAGIKFETLMNSQTGCYVGCMTNDYEMLSLHDIYDVGHSAAAGLSEAMSANRVSWFFGLQGPSLTIDTACSSSLYALHMACQSIRTGETDQALVAGINLILGPGASYQFSAMHMLSPEGISHTFDDRANGYGRGEGIGCLIVKRLQDAIRDGDNIRAVIRGTGVNADGKTPSVTQPSSVAQADLIRRTYASAGLELSSTQYFECHGTGTPVGDPIELQALASTLGLSRAEAQAGPLFIGSVKPNVGHTEGCSGLAGVIKATLCLEKGVLVPTLGVETVNPKLKLDVWNLTLPNSVMPWPERGQRRISVNSFGFGGANAHAILDDAYHYLQERGLRGNHHTVEQSGLLSSHSDSGLSMDTDVSPTPRMEGQDRKRLFAFSGKDQGAISRLSKSYADRLDSVLKPETDFLDQLAWTLASRRSHLDYRSFTLSSTLTGLRTQLIKGLPKSKRANSQSQNIVFVCTGQGAQWPTMGLQLLQYPVFVASVNQSQHHLKALGCAWEIIDELSKTDTSNIHLSEYSQTLCTVVQVALIDLVRHWGVVPRATLGHSSGEIAAAYAAGFLSQADAIKVAYVRGICSASVQQRGAMLAVGLSALQAKEFLTRVPENAAVVACVNSPSSVTLSGDVDAIDTLEKVISATGAFARKLKVQTAYHSPHMRNVAQDYLTQMGQIQPMMESNVGEPETIMFSSLTGKQAVPAELTEDYWMNNMCAPVEFADAFAALLAHKSSASNSRRLVHTKWDTFLEIGPHAALQGPFQQIAAESPNKSTKEAPYLSMLLRNKDADTTALHVAGNLWVQGHNVSLARINGYDDPDAVPNGLVDLPPYPWNHTRSYWHESHLGRSNRYPDGPRTDLLGQKESLFSVAEPRWKNYLRISENPWIEDHKITGTILYPGAGMLIMALEGAKEMSDTAQSLSGFRFRNVEFKRGLVVPLGEDSAVETRLSLIPDSHAPSQFQFRISSTTSSQWTEHCKGVVELDYAIPADQEIEDAGMLDAEWQHQTAKYQALVAESTSAKEIDVAEFYDHLESIGMEYGPLFRNTVKLSSIPALLGAHASVVVPDTLSCMPANHDFVHVIHPATLDALFHLLLAAFNDGEPIHESAVPYSIDEMYISAEQPLEAGSLYKGYGSLTNKSQDGHETIGDLVVADEAWTSPKVVVKNFALRRVTAAGDGSKAKNDEQDADTSTCARIEWRRDVDLIAKHPATLASDTREALSEWILAATHKTKIRECLVAIDGSIESSASIVNLLQSLVGQEQGIQSFTTLAVGGSGGAFGGLDERWDLTQSNPPTCLSRMYDLVLWLNATSPLQNTAQLQMLYSAVSAQGRFVCSSPMVSTQNTDAIQQSQLHTGSINLIPLPVGSDSTLLVSDMSGADAIKAPAEVCIILPDESPPLTSVLVSHLERKLAARGIKTEVATIAAAVVEQMRDKFVISLLEVERPFIHNWTEEQFQHFKSLVFAIKHMLWISHGSVLKDWSGGVEFAAAQGLLRVLRNEIPGPVLAHFDLSTELSLDGVAVSEMIHSVWMASMLPKADMEFAELDHGLYIQRTVTAAEIDEELQQAQGKEMTQWKALQCLDGAAKLLQRSGELESLWIPLNHEQDFLAEREVLLDVHVLNLGNQAASNTCVGRVLQCGKSVSTLTSGQRVICFGIEGCATNIRQDESMVFALPKVDMIDDTVALTGSLMTAYYALSEVAQLQRGQSVLITTAGTSLGLASIRVANKLGCKVFALVDDKSTKNLLINSYGVASEHIFSVTRQTFVRAIHRATDGAGVDAVIGFQPSSADSAAVQVLRDFGCFVEVADARIPGNVMHPTSKGSSTFVRVDSLSAFRARPSLMRQAYQRTVELFSSEMVATPQNLLHCLEFSASEVHEALRIKNSDVDREVLVSFAKDNKILTLASPVPKPRMDSEGVYVLAGGLGALGLKIADMMIDQGARRLAFLSRSGGSKNQSELDNFRARGIEAEAFKCDINDRESVKAVFESITTGEKIIRGIVQSAMVLEDTIFENMTHAKWDRAFRPKTVGSRNLLDQLSPVHNPFFILLSSITGIIGNTAQANYASGNTCEDALANHARRHRGIRATSIDVGLVTDSSHFTSEGEFGDIEHYLSRYSHGWKGLKTNIAELQVAMLAVMHDTGASLPAQVILGLGNCLIREEGSTGFQQDAKFNLRTIMRTSNNESDTVSIQEQLRTATSVSEAAAVVELQIKKQVGVAIGIEVEDVDVQKPLFDFGVDSLKAVELRNQIAGEMKCDISVFDLLSPTPIIELAQKIASRSELVVKDETDT